MKTLMKAYDVLVKNNHKETSTLLFQFVAYGMTKDTNHKILTVK